MIDDSEYHAQTGEDRLLNEHFGSKDGGFFVEVGACDGVEMSNTYFFEQKGWGGILIEADPALAECCRKSRPGSTLVNVAVVPPNTDETITFEIAEDNNGLSSISLMQSELDRLRSWTGANNITKITVRASTLDTILETNNVDHIDFITVDVEGHEWGVLQGFTINRWKPQVIILERNTLLPDSRIMGYMHSNGYIYLKTTGVNDWFVPGQKTPAYWTLLYGGFYGPKLLRFTLRAVKNWIRTSVSCLTIMN